MSCRILPPAMLGILGGGQLGRYFVCAAHELGYQVMVLDPDPLSPAGRIADVHLQAAYDDPVALQRLADECKAITTEFENVPSASMRWLAQYIPVRPSGDNVAVCQDRIEEKRFLSRSGLPLAPYAEIHTETDIVKLDACFFPGILKIASMGYDGKGQVVVQSTEEAVAAFYQFKAVPCVLEKRLRLQRELSVILARDINGNMVNFPPTQNHHSNGILDYSIQPAPEVSAVLVSQAESLAKQIATAMDYIGVLSVEFFVVENQLMVNELAPRPHNSGHYTLDACVTNQFEQQVRVLCGLPLGETRAHSSAVMVNLLGDLWPLKNPEGKDAPKWEALLYNSHLKLHFYGKEQARAGRKMGHYTVIGAEPLQVLSTALNVRTMLHQAD
jgi:5-(carboxyamino)imidazole ribonucleotide synthase